MSNAYTREEFDATLAILLELLNEFELQQDETLMELSFDDFVQWLRGNL